MHSSRLRRCLEISFSVILSVGCANALVSQSGIASPPASTVRHELAAVGGLATQRPGFQLDDASTAPGTAEPLHHLRVTDPSVLNPQGGAQVIFQSQVADGAVEGQAAGLRVRFMTTVEGTWIIGLGVKDRAGTNYACKDAYCLAPANRLITLDFPFSAFRMAGNPTKGLDGPQSIGSISPMILGKFPTGCDVYIDDVHAYSETSPTSWLEFTTSKQDGLYQPGETPGFHFVVAGSPAPGASGFRYEVTDFDGTLVQHGSFPLDGRSAYDATLTATQVGYYEVRAHWTGADGKDLTDASCIRSVGSMPGGLGVFCVLPTTLAQNKLRLQQVGWDSFFGSQCTSHGIDELMGLPWRLESFKWRAIQPTKPLGVNSTPWFASESKLAQDGRPLLGAFLSNNDGDTPAWAKQPDNWDAYRAFVRECVDAEKARFPDAPQRYYGGGWELDLTTPNVSDAATVYKNTAAAIHGEDPRAIVMGPNASSLNFPWFEKLFQQGVFDSLDAIDTHAYIVDAYSPEVYDYPAKLRQLNDLVQKYHGKTLPIFISEIGFSGVLGSDWDYRGQAQLMTRTAIILKGEGVRAFFPFFGIDFDEQQLGFLFNKDPNERIDSSQVAPKPVINGIATCAMELEGATPVQRLGNLGEDVWAYQFKKGDRTIIAVWVPYGSATVAIPVSGATSAIVVTMMGVSQPASINAGQVNVTASPSPQYVEFGASGRG